MTTTTPVRTRPTRPRSAPPRPRRARPAAPRPARTRATPARSAPGPRAPMEPRLRSRRIEVAREQGRRRLRRLLVVLGAVGMVAAAGGVVVSPLLDVDRVVLTGVPADHAAQARAVIEVSRGEPLLLVDTGAVAERLEAQPWVEHASVSRSLPGTLRVTIVPRVAVGWTSGPGGPQIIGAGGRVLGTATQAPAGLPELPTAVAAASRVAGALPGSLRARVASVVVDRGSRTAVLTLVGGTEVRLGTLHNVRAKVRAAEVVLAAMVGRSPRYVDVQVPSAPAVA